MTFDDHLTALIPRGLAPRHHQHYYLAMLRLEARRRSGDRLNPEETVRLGRWLSDVRSLSAVVLYDPETRDGFFLVPRLAEDDDIVRLEEWTAA